MFFFHPLLDLLVGIFSLLLALYWYQTKNFKYWEKRGVPYLKPHWFFGNLGHQIMQRKTCTEFAKNTYNRFKENGYGGMFIFRQPSVVLCDPDLIANVLTKDFIHFEDRAVASNPDEVLSNTLYSASGEKWRIMRHKLSSTFSTAKVKGMFDQVLRCAECFTDEIKERSKTNVDIDVDSLAFVFSTEAIASCTFGVQLMTNSAGASDFKKAVDIVFDDRPFRLGKMILGIVWPRVFQLLKIQFIPKEVTRFFTNLTKESIAYRAKNNIKRNDFLQLLLKLKENEETGDIGDDYNSIVDEDKVMVKNCTIKEIDKLKSNEKYFTENSISSLMFNLLSSGVKPLAASISFALMEIARSSDIQETLRNEVESSIAKHGGLNYRAIASMTYLDQVIQEVHRLYPFSKVLMRRVTSPYKLPGTEVVLEKGTVVYIPVSAIHVDPNYYPSPEDFKPDRFAGNNFKPNFAFMPYGNGPRICIGIKFAVLLMKVCVAKVVSEYDVAPAMQVPITSWSSICSPRPTGGVRLYFHKRDRDSTI